MHMNMNAACDLPCPKNLFLAHIARHSHVFQYTIKPASQPERLAINYVHTFLAQGASLTMSPLRLTDPHLFPGPKLRHTSHIVMYVQ